MTSTSTDAEFEAFVDANHAYLSRAAYLITSDRAVAEDLLQEALVRTYRAWRRIEPGLARAYCRRTMVNLTTDRWRRRRFEAPAVEPVDRADPRADRDYAGVDDRDAIARELAALPPRERAVVVLRFYADLSEADVAAELGIALGTVKSTCHRALQRLRSHLGPELSHGG
ncbi:SigE family RNA polymerase sigma factor [Propioniciclava sp.]|uniref:SigE family RNA polymerase sigma factor n=1 Tax=Propioniciclava sp. TaxID=2038686 RepID=UPI0026183DA2|nr:SigE family RNA polymerase sigma factor [Propioniciclava sp.]